ncbi:MAG: hypothetical protein KC433_13250 [Anaerolineales bacterium]|nr:hypothetical protein [Anaerolineales bacterium]MCB8937141.1 hypothetical protein [Ardenticatenaceae bacterium]
MKNRIQLSWKASLIFVIVWFLLASIALGYWPLIRDEEEIATITHDLYGFSIDYPTKWKISLYGENGYRGNDDLKLQLSKNTFNNFSIFIYQTSASNATLHDVHSWRMQSITRLNPEEFKYSQISFDEDKLRGHPIIRHIYTINDVKCEDVYIVRSQDMLIIRLQAPIGEFDNYLGEFEAIVASFRPLE